MQTHYDDFFEEVFVELEAKVGFVNVGGRLISWQTHNKRVLNVQVGGDPAAATLRKDTSICYWCHQQASKLGWSCGPSLPKLLSDHHIVLGGGLLENSLVKEKYGPLPRNVNF